MDPANGPSVDFTIAFSVQTGENHMDWIHNVAHVTQRVEDPVLPTTLGIRAPLDECMPMVAAASLSFQTRLMQGRYLTK